MAEPLVSTGAAAVAAAAWFSDKLFGPTAEAIGETLKCYLNDRLKRILDAAAHHTADMAVTPIQPGLVATLIMNASFSADEPMITDWWASLIADAAAHSSNKHAIFSDIMAMMGPAEAHIFNHAMQGWSYVLDELDDQGRRVLASSIETSLDFIVSESVGPLPCPAGWAVPWLQQNGALNLTWPCWAAWWALPRRREDNTVSAPTSGSWFACQDPIVIDALERIGIFGRRRISLMGENCNGWVTVLYITPLGLDFYRVVTLRNLEEFVS